MMIEQQVRDKLMSAIEATRPHPLRHYHVCYWQGDIRCLPSHHTTRCHPVFFTVAGQVLARGLSPRQLWALTHRILHICRMTGLELDGLRGDREAAAWNRHELEEEIVR